MTGCVGGGMFAAPWSPCTMAYVMRMRYISDESVPAYLGRHTLSTRRCWRCQRGTLMSSVIDRGVLVSKNGLSSAELQNVVAICFADGKKYVNCRL
jgi:hypothetical protein